MSATVINLARFRACLELQRHGATAGEREAARAAAARIVAGAGLDLAEAMRLSEKADAGSRPSSRPRPKQKKPKPAPAQPAPPLKWKPTTIAELLAEREAKAERLRKKVEREMRETKAAQWQWMDEARDAQARRDREWAAARNAQGPKIPLITIEPTCLIKATYSGRRAACEGWLWTSSAGTARNAKDGSTL